MIANQSQTVLTKGVMPPGGRSVTRRLDPLATTSPKRSVIARFPSSLGKHQVVDISTKSEEPGETHISTPLSAGVLSVVHNVAPKTLEPGADA